MTTSSRLRQRRLDADAWMEAHRHLMTRSTAAERQDRESRDMGGDFSPVRPAWGSGEVSGISVIGQTAWSSVDGFDFGHHSRIGFGGFTYELDDDGTPVFSGHSRTGLRSHPDMPTFERRLRARIRRSRQRDQQVPSTGRLARRVADERGRLSMTTGYTPSEAERYEETRPMISRGRIHTTPIPELYRQQAARIGARISWPDEEHQYRLAGRREAVSQMSRHGHLSDMAPILGARIPRSLWFDRHRGWYQSRQGRTMHLADVYTPEGLDRIGGPITGDLTSEEQVVSQDMDEQMTELPAHVVEWVQQRLTPSQWECLISEDLSSDSVRRQRSRALAILEREMPSELRIRR